ncbi:MAG: endonuclease III domain-containing protein [Deltaproteobacteria bacterium]|nr:endonuclease III domain-containing protein [Deltaproteobacteria bacterium]
MENRISEIYRRLFGFFGPQSWWPGETPFEIMVGAVLTQNTAWINVEKAIKNLKDFNLLSFDILVSLPPQVLAEHIRPCGYYNLKAGRLQNLLRLIDEEFAGDVDSFLDLELAVLRQALLAVKGIGRETADSICLYAANKPIFVVDAYTHRILSRHDLVLEDGADYDEVQEIFMAGLPEDTAMFNEYHALLVRLGKEYCKKSKPKCDICPLKGL